MKTTLALALTAVALTFASNANAEEFRFGPFSISTNNQGQFNGHNHNHNQNFNGQHQQGNRYPSNFNGRPIIADPHQHNTNYRPNPYNNPIHVQPTQVERVVFDPSTGRWIVKTGSEVIHQSATDPNRNVVDPGSYRASSSISQDQYGRTIETRVESWTSYGVPHSNTTRKVKQDFGGVEVEDNHTVVRSVAPRP